MKATQLKGMVLFGLGWVAIFLLYLATAADSEWSWVVVVWSCKSLPFLLPVVFTISGYHYFWRNREIEEGNLASLKVGVALLNAIAAIAVAFLLASVLRDTLISKLKFGNWSVYVGESTPMTFAIIASCVLGVAVLLMRLNAGKIGRALNGATLGAVAGAVCMYAVLPIQ